MDHATRLISGFIDACLPLSEEENKEFERLLSQLPKERQEAIMEITTSWKQEGFEQGRQEGMLVVVNKQLLRHLGPLPNPILAKIQCLPPERLEALSVALLEFATIADLEQWLRSKRKKR